jgi:hypothetical protein
MLVFKGGRYIFINNGNLQIKIAEKFIKNYHDFWSDYRWFIVVFILSLICDAASTINFMLKDGAEIEMHPVINFVSRICGYLNGRKMVLFQHGS